MEQKTHLAVDPSWVGVVERLDSGWSRVGLTARAEMAVDDSGLVHGGFTFGLADYAAMVAVNDPHVVLGAADVRFKAPVQVGQRMMAEARVAQSQGRRRSVSVSVETEGVVVLEGEFTTFVLEHHVLKDK